MSNMENKSDYSFQITVQTLAGLIFNLQESQEIKFFLPEQQQLWEAICLKHLEIPIILIGCKEQKDIHLFNKAVDCTWTGVLSALEDTIYVSKDEVVLVNSKPSAKSPTYSQLVNEITQMLKSRNLSELKLNEEMDNTAYFVWFDGDNEAHNSPVMKVSLDEKGDLDIIVGDSEYEYTLSSAYDFDNLKIDDLETLKENILETLGIVPVEELTNIPDTITEFLKHPNIECTDPASLQFSLQIASGDYLYLESAYVGLPKEALSDADCSVLNKIKPYFNDPVQFLKEVREGKFEYGLLHEDYWYFGRVEYGYISSNIRMDIISAYGLKNEEDTTEENFKQLICEGYFETYQDTDF